MARRGFGTGLLKGLNSGYYTMQDNQRKRRESSLDALTKQAALEEAGFKIEGSPNMFGGGQTVVRDPSFIGNKALERQKTSLELQKLQQDMKDAKTAREMLTGGQSNSFASGYRPKTVKFGGQEFQPSDRLTPGQELAKDKATKEIFEKYEFNKERQSNINKAIEGRETIPQGWTGKLRVGAAQKFPSMKGMLGVDDEAIKNSQELKIALTMGTLAETAYTKGAISDQEMNLFKEASANNDFNSPAVIPVLEKIANFVQAENSGMMGAYKKNYGEDPETWFGQNADSGQQNFNSPEEADASGLPIGTIVLVQGKRYQI